MVLRGHCELSIARALSVAAETGTIPGRHSRAGGNPGFSAWIPGLAPLARNDGLPHTSGLGNGHFVSEQERQRRSNLQEKQRLLRSARDDSTA